MIGIPIALAYTNISEWLIHKYWLHGLGKNKKSFWSFHWHEHHRESRKNDMFDPQYERTIFSWSPQGKEVLALIGGAVAVTPLLPVAPFFTATVWYRTVRYYQMHKKAHLDPACPQSGDFHAKGDNRWQPPVRDSLCWPYAVAQHDGVAIVSDSGNNRIVLWPLADEVVG